MSTDPNRFVEGFEAVSIRERIQHEETELAILQQKLDDADGAVHAAMARVLEAEEHHRLQISVQDDARRKCDTQRAELDRQYALFHPVRKVTLEILGHIFEMCLEGLSIDDFPGAEDSDILNRQRQPFDLAAVCRRWRSASLSYPRAWSRLELVFKGCSLTYDSKWSSVLDLHISRSCSAPVTLLIRRWEPPCSHPGTTVTNLLPLMARCTALHAYFEELTGQDPILALLTADTPRLKEASIFVPEHPSLPSSFQLFPHAPALLGLASNGFFDFAPAALRSVERLALVSTSSLRVRDDALRALSAAANVKTLELVNITIAPDPSVGTRVILPSLTHLEIGISNDQPLANLLQAVDFPKLSVLLVNGQYRNAKCRLDLLRDLSSAYRLTGVEVDYIGPEHWQSFLGTLRTMAHLKNLIIPTCALRADTLANFCDTLMPSGDVWPAPRLVSVDFDDSTFANDCDPAAVLELVKARLQVPQSVAQDEEPAARLSTFLVSGWTLEGRSNLQADIDALMSASAAETA